MTIHLDTSVLIDALAGPRPLLSALAARTESGDRTIISALVLYEWLRGPRTRTDLLMQEELFPRAEVVAFGVPEADMASKLYARVRRARDREIDIAIAACTIVHGAFLWTLNRGDFEDIPDLRLV